MSEEADELWKIIKLNHKSCSNLAFRLKKSVRTHLPRTIRSSSHLARWKARSSVACHLLISDSSTRTSTKAIVVTGPWVKRVKIIWRTLKKANSHFAAWLMIRFWASSPNRQVRTWVAPAHCCSNRRTSCRAARRGSSDLRPSRSKQLLRRLIQQLTRPIRWIKFLARKRSILSQRKNHPRRS